MKRASDSCLLLGVHERRLQAPNCPGSRRAARQQRHGCAVLAAADGLIRQERVAGD
jgi:hypothetical protein